MWQKQRWRKHPSSWLSRLWFRSEPTHLPPAVPALMPHLHHCRFLYRKKKKASSEHFIPHKDKITDVNVNTATLWIDTAYNIAAVFVRAHRNAVVFTWFTQSETAHFFPCGEGCNPLLFLFFCAKLQNWT